MEKIRNAITFCQELLSVFNDKREALLLVDIPAVSQQPNLFRMTMSETEIVTKIVTKVVTEIVTKVVARDNDVKYYKPNGWENMKSLSETPVETPVVTEIVTASVTEKKKQNKRKKKIPLHPLKKKKNKKKKKITPTNAYACEESLS